MATPNDNGNNVKRLAEYETAFVATVQKCSTLTYARELGAKDGAAAVSTVLRKGRKGEHRAGLAALILADIPAVDALPTEDTEQN